MSPLDDAVLPVVGAGALAVLAGAWVDAAGAEDDVAALDDAVLDGAVLEVDAAGALEREVSVLALEVVRLPAQPTMTKAASAAAMAAAVPERVRIMSCSSEVVDGQFGPQRSTQQRVCLCVAKPRQGAEHPLLCRQP